MIQDPREAVKYLLTLFGLAALITLVVLAASTFSHATTSHRNSIGVPMYTVNPYIYEAGEIVNYAIIDGDKGLVIRVQPVATYSLYTDEILFCGVPADKINGHENPMVLVYRRGASRMVDGLGCHELVQVRDIKAEKVQ